MIELPEWDEPTYCVECAHCCFDPHQKYIDRQAYPKPIKNQREIEVLLGMLSISPTMTNPSGLTTGDIHQRILDKIRNAYVCKSWCDAKGDYVDAESTRATDCWDFKQC